LELSGLIHRSRFLEAFCKRSISVIGACRENRLRCLKSSFQHGLHRDTMKVVSAREPRMSHIVYIHISFDPTAYKGDCALLFASVPCLKYMVEDKTRKRGEIASLCRPCTWDDGWKVVPNSHPSRSSRHDNVQILMANSMQGPFAFPCRSSKLHTTRAPVYWTMRVTRPVATVRPPSRMLTR
jgi:hypothetical protein